MKKQSLDIRVGGHDLSLTSENTLVNLFRVERFRDIDYCRVEIGDEEWLTIWRNAEFCRYIAGLDIIGNKIEVPINSDRNSFYETYGWSAPTLIRDEPTEAEIDDWIAVEMGMDVANDGNYRLPDED